MFDGIKSIYDESKTVHRTDPTKSIIILFRIFLEKVPSWSNEILETETNRIINLSNCDWIDDLLTAVFISHTKILTSIGSNHSHGNVDLTIPKTINFVHKCYINIARKIWKNPYLFDDFVIGSDYQKNMNVVEKIIRETIENTIRNLLPINILKQHLETYETNNNEIQNRNTQNHIRKMLLEIIKKIEYS